MRQIPPIASCASSSSGSLDSRPPRTVHEVSLAIREARTKVTRTLFIWGGRRHRGERQNSVRHRLALADQPRTTAFRCRDDQLEALPQAAVAKRYEKSTPPAVVVLAREIPVSRRPVHQTSMTRLRLAPRRSSIIGHIDVVAEPIGLKA